MLITDTGTFDAVHDLMDMVQRVDQKVNRLCQAQGIDPAEAGRLPDDPAEREAA